METASEDRRQRETEVISPDIEGRRDEGRQRSQNVVAIDTWHDAH